MGANFGGFLAKVRLLLLSGVVITANVGLGSCLCVWFQAETRKGKRLTGREIKKKTLAERREPLAVENMREDSLRWV